MFKNSTAGAENALKLNFNRPYTSLTSVDPTAAVDVGHQEVSHSSQTPQSSVCWAQAVPYKQL